MNFTIEKGVTLPEIKRGMGSKWAQIPFNQMEVGDSILIDTIVGKPKEITSKFKNIYSSVSKVIRDTKPEGKFRVAMIDADGKTEVRIWKTE